MNIKSILLIFLIAISPGWISAGGENHKALNEDELVIQKGIASYYGRKFHLRKTANGETFNMEELTAAHKNLPFGTKVKVTNVKNNKTVWVRINDRLPQNSKRILDLSKAAANKIEMIDDGLAKVEIEVSDGDTVLSLLEYYEENVPENMRLRYYEDPLEVSKPDLGLPKFEKSLVYKMVASLF